MINQLHTLQGLHADCSLSPESAALGKLPFLQRPSIVCLLPHILQPAPFSPSILICVTPLECRLLQGRGLRWRSLLMCLGWCLIQIRLNTSSPNWYTECGEGRWLSQAFPRSHLHSQSTSGAPGTQHTIQLTDPSTTTAAREGCTAAWDVSARGSPLGCQHPGISLTTDHMGTHHLAPNQVSDYRKQVFSIIISAHGTESQLVISHCWLSLETVWK